MARALKYCTLPFTPRPSIADGIRVQQVGQKTLAICRRVLDDIICVTEEEVHQAMRSLARIDHVHAEGAGAVDVAGLRHLRGRKKVAVVSGGNIDPAQLAGIIHRKEPAPSAHGKPLPPLRRVKPGRGRVPSPIRASPPAVRRQSA